MEIIIDINHLQLGHILKHPKRYESLIDDISRLPVPHAITIGIRRYYVPQSLDDLTESICYGQRLYLAKTSDNDIETVIRMLCGYYYPLTGKQWDDDKVTSLLSKLKLSLAIELFPTGLKILSLMGELVEREQKLLNRKIKPEEIEAGIDKLNKFSDLSAIDFLRDSKRLNTDNEVMLLPYSECLVRFWKEKEEQTYKERLTEIYNKPKK